jgi:hypothetical protein
MAVGRGLDPEKFKLLAQFKSRYVLTSGANVPVYDENGDRRHSMFAKSFLEVLRQNKNVLSIERRNAVTRNDHSRTRESRASGSRNAGVQFPAGCWSQSRRFLLRADGRTTAGCDPFTDSG